MTEWKIQIFAPVVKFFIFIGKFLFIFQEQRPLNWQTVGSCTIRLYIVDPSVDPNKRTEKNPDRWNSEFQIPLKFGIFLYVIKKGKSVNFARVVGYPSPHFFV